MLMREAGNRQVVPGQCLAVKHAAKPNSYRIREQRARWSRDVMMSCTGNPCGERTPGRGNSKCAQGKGWSDLWPVQWVQQSRQWEPRIERGQG